MKKNLYLLAVLLLLIILSKTAISAQEDHPTQDAELAARVKTAFENAAKYDFHALRELEPYGKKLVPYLEPYLDGKDLSIRYLLMGLIKDAHDSEYIPLLAKALRNSEPDIVKQSSVYLYDNFDHRLLSQNKQVGDALRQSIRNGNKSLSSIILLGYFPESDSEAVLSSIINQKAACCWSNKVSFFSEIAVTIPAYLSLYRINNQKYYNQLIEQTRKASIGETEFFLYSLNYIEDKKLLKIIFEKGIVSEKILESEYGIEGQVLQNSMRVSDLTINEFARKYNLDLGFKLQETRYSQNKINLARQRINAFLSK